MCKKRRVTLIIDQEEIQKVDALREVLWSSANRTNPPRNTQLKMKQATEDKRGGNNA
jgi:hypothetical protein